MTKNTIKTPSVVRFFITLVLAGLPSLAHSQNTAAVDPPPEKNALVSLIEDLKKKLEGTIQELAKLQGEVNELKSATPPKAVIAFDQAECPTGWEAFSAAAGRSVFGAGGGLAHGQNGGGAQFTLMLDNLPKHDHGNTMWWGGRSKEDLGPMYGSTKEGLGYPWYAFYNKPFHDDVWSITNRLIKPEGEENPKPVPTMPPYVVLTYCTRGR